MMLERSLSFSMFDMHFYPAKFHARDALVQGKGFLNLVCDTYLTFPPVTTLVPS